MFKSYLKIALRNLKNNKTYSVSNVLSLSIALVCAIFIMLWVRYELSFDRFHENIEQICLAYLKGTHEDQISYQSTTSPVIAKILKDDFPEILNSARVGTLGDLVFQSGDKKIIEKKGVGADPELLDMFTFHFLKGDPNTALSDPHSIILTVSMAQKYFSDENPIGKTVTINNQFNFFVKAVIADIPENSHRRYDFIVRFDFLKELGYMITGERFYPCIYHTYVFLQKDISYQLLSTKVSKHIFSEGEEITFEIALLPLAEVYLHESGGIKKIYIFSLVALTIIVIACFNFMNLSIAQSTKRAKEVGIRKVSGATRWQIVQQIIGESIIMSIIAILFAILMVEILTPQFNSLTEKVVALDYFDASWFLTMVGLILFSGILAGSYPAFFLSKFQPVKVLKAGSTTWSNRSTFRKTLLILQFAISIIFIISTITMNRQLNYIRNFHLGLNQENIFYVKLDGDIKNKIPEVKNELLKNANIKFVSSSSRIPTVIRSGSYRKWGREVDHSRRICEVYVDFDFLNTFDVKMAEGRFYSKDYSSDLSESIIVNETAIKMLGNGYFTGKPFYYVDSYKRLIGVIKDFQHISPLFSAPHPLVFHLRPNGNDYLFVKIDNQKRDIHQITETTNYIKSVCNAFSPNYPLQYSYLNEYTYDREKKIEIRQRIILYATLFAILVSALGLFGLSAFLNEQRTKEIGIRKVTGATLSNLVILLTKDITKLALIANILAWPIAWYVVHQWLQNFAYRVSVGLWIFILAGLAALLISILTVSYQAIHTASVNPVNALRYE